MAIQIYCTNCHNCFAIKKSACPKCLTPAKSSKKYRVEISFKGKRITRHFDNLTLAREAEVSIKTDLMRGDLNIEHKKKSVPTLNQIWEQYLPWAKENKKTWDDDYYHYGKHIGPVFGKTRLDDITPIDIERFKMELKKGVSQYGKPYTPATIKHQLVLLNRLYNLARKWGLYDGKNPLDQVDIPKLDNQVTEFLTADETTRLIETLQSWPDQEAVSIVMFSLLTGVRRGEIFKLTWDDVDLERGMITLKEPKGKKTQTIPISQEVINLLRELPVKSKYVFFGKNGGQRTCFRKPWTRIKKAAELPPNFRFHGLRHNVASALVSSGCDLMVVQKLLTHKDARTTQRYAHLAPGVLKEAAQKSAKIIKPEIADVIPIQKKSEKLND